MELKDGCSTAIVYDAEAHHDANAAAAAKGMSLNRRIVHTPRVAARN